MSPVLVTSEAIMRLDDDFPYPDGITREQRHRACLTFSRLVFSLCQVGELRACLALHDRVKEKLGPDRYYSIGIDPQSESADGSFLWSITLFAPSIEPEWIAFAEQLQHESLLYPLYDTRYVLTHYRVRNEPETPMD